MITLTGNVPSRGTGWRRQLSVDIKRTKIASAITASTSGKLSAAYDRRGLCNLVTSPYPEVQRSPKMDDRTTENPYSRPSTDKSNNSEEWKPPTPTSRVRADPRRCGLDFGPVPASRKLISSR